MSKAFRGFIFIGLTIVGSVSATSGAYAQTTSASSTITITATVEATRSVLINPQGKVLRILSNTPKDAPPKFYQGSFESTPITPTQSILDQYHAIMGRIDTSHAGVIYRWSPSQPASKYSMLITISLNMVAHYI